MKPVYRNLIFLCLFFMIVALAWHMGDLHHYINLQTIKDNQQFLLTQINARPLLSGIVYIIICFIVTLSALPVTLGMIAIGGFLFGTSTGAVYALVSMLASSICTFKLSKRMFGRYVQQKYALSKDLKKRGMTFVGTTIIYAFMQAVGMVDDHIASCWKRTE